MRRWTMVSWVLITSFTLAWMLPTDSPAQTGAGATPQAPQLQTGTPAGTSAGSESGVLGAIEHWRFSTEGAIRSSPAVVDGVIYIGSNDTHLYAIDAADGAERWRFKTRGEVWSSPAVAGGVVFVGSLDGNLYAIDVLLGTEIWRAAIGEVVYSSPTVVDGIVYVGRYEGGAIALDAETGSERWRFEDGGTVNSKPEVMDGVVFIAGSYGYLHALDAENGRQLWRFYTEEYHYLDSPTVVDGVVYVGSAQYGPGYGSVYAVDAVSGLQQWSFAAQSSIHTAPAVLDGIVYFGDDSATIYSVDAVSGMELWRFSAGEYISSSPSVINRVVYVGSDDGNLYAIGAESGMELWRFSTGDYMDSTPTVVAGVVYVGSSDGNLYAIELPSPEQVAAAQAEQIAKQQAELALDTYLTDLSTALSISSDIPAGFNVIEGGISSAPVPNPFPPDFVDYRLVGFALPAAVGNAFNAVAVVRYGTDADAEGGASTAASGLTRAGWVEVEVDGIEHDHTCLTLASATDAKAVCYVTRDAIVLVTLSYLGTPNLDAATTNAVDLAVYANAVFDRVPRPAS